MAFLARGTWRRPKVDRQVVFSVVTMAVSSFGTLGFPVLIPTIRGDLHLSAAAVGAIASATYAAALATAVPAGRLADRVGAAPIIGIAQATIAGGLLVVSLAGGTVGFFFGVTLVGAGYGIVTPATNLVAMNTSAVRSRGLVMSVKQAGVTVGGIAAGAILPGLAALVGWRTALAVPIISCLCVGVHAARHRTRDESRPGPIARSGGSRPSTGVRTAAILGSYGFLMSGVQFVIFSYLALYLVDRHGQSATLAGSELSLVFLGASVGRLAWGVISDHVFAARDSSLQLAAAGTCAALALVPFASGSGTVVPLLLALGFCAVGWNGVFQAVVADSTPYSSLGRASGAALACIYLGAVLLPPSFGLALRLTASWPESWALAAACPALSLVLFRIVGPPSRFSLRREPA